MKKNHRHFVFLACCSLLSVGLHAQKKNAAATIQTANHQYEHWQMKPVSIKTRWAKDVSPANALVEYPRPQMMRNKWENLNGLWEYAITGSEAAKPEKFDGKILVPYPLESALSGVQKALLPSQCLWYRKAINKPDISGDKRVLLHFGAVDWDAKVFLNNKEIGTHTGGYQNFSFDITDQLNDGQNILELSVKDPSNRGINPHGKQVLHPHNIMYTATSGIWQTVWMETVPENYITNVRITPDVDRGVVKLVVFSEGSESSYTVEAVASNGKNVKGKPNSELLLPVPNAKLWSPDNPHLYDLKIKLYRNGKTVDAVSSYFGMRKIEVKKDEKGIDRLFLNNKYTFHLGVLDQGFWPEGLYTAPTDAALKFDIMAIKNMGYNTIRKHVKIEPARWYYHADKAGVLVWQDMITCGNDTKEARVQFEKENKENIAQLYNYPSIVIWVLFNEGWGRYDQQRLTEWIKKEDPSRIVNGHSGENYDRGSPPEIEKKWAGSDLTDIHDYPGPGIPDALPGKARVLGEWGGVRVPTRKHQWNDVEGWGYIQVTASAFKNKYDSLVKKLALLEKEGLSGSVYTEPFDVETEENGMMTYDREVIKIAPEELRNIHKQVLAQAVDYAAAPGSLQIAVTDTVNYDLQYSAWLEQFRNGKRDPEFLRELTLMASRAKDEKSVLGISAAYVNSLSDPLSLHNLLFIEKFTRCSHDPGFKIMLDNLERSDLVLGNNRATNKLKGIIYEEDIKAYDVRPVGALNWNQIEKAIMAKYPGPGDEILLRAKAAYYANNKVWDSLVTTTNILLKKYGYESYDWLLNEFAWVVFENVNDTSMLQHALEWARLSLKTAEKAHVADTYANLLFKLGNKEEAIKWETKAIELDPTDQGFVYTLKRMKGEQ